MFLQTYNGIYQGYAEISKFKLTVSKEIME